MRLVTHACGGVSAGPRRCGRAATAGRTAAKGVDWDGESGQAVLLLVAAMAAVVVGAVFLGGVARGIGKGGREQRAADLGALAGARSMHESYTRLFEPPGFAGKPNPRHL